MSIQEKLTRPEGRKIVLNNKDLAEILDYPNHTNKPLVGFNKITVSATEPVNPQAGDLWIQIP